MESSTDTADYILQAPVFNPILPYVTTIFGSLVPGRMVLVQGTVLMMAERFQVDFQTGSSLSPRADIAIHFNPRFRPRPHVICNALRNGHWMEETKFLNLALKGGDTFQLLFLFEQEHVKVSVNGLHFLQYHFNIPLARMNTLGVSGDIFVKTIAFLGGNPFENSRTGYPLAPHLHLKDPNLAVPLNCQFSQTLQPGDEIIVRGLVHQDPKEFHISLKRDPSHVVLSLSVHFKDQTVLWKSFADQGQDSGEKLATCFPFHPQRYFEQGCLSGAGMISKSSSLLHQCKNACFNVAVLGDSNQGLFVLMLPSFDWSLWELLFHCEKGHLKLALNGVPLGQQHLPIPSAEPITELAVEGDVTLYSILC